MPRNQVLPARRAMASVGIVAVLALARAADANGAFPDEFSVHFPATSQRRILMGANFGLLVSEDDGATWRYSCEPWVTEGSSAALSQSSVNFYQVTADGAVIAQSVEVTRSDDVACTWPPSGGAIAGKVVSDLFPDPNDASFVIAIIAVPSGSYLVASHDGGKTFADQPLYTTNDLLVGIEMARSTPAVVYATALALSGSGARLLRSADSGGHWTSTSLPIAAGTQPRILAIDPADANTVYLRVLGGLSDSIVITTDAGQTFRAALTIPGQFTSFLRAGDGSLYAGTMTGELYVRRPGATVFTRHAGPHLRCLGQRPGTPRIFACGDMGLDGFSLGYSDDGGATFKPMMSFTGLLGPLTCAQVQTNCAAHWTRIQQVLGIGGTDAGSSDAGASPPPPNTGGGGSRCGSAGSAAVSMLGLFSLLLLRRRYIPEPTKSGPS